MHRRLSTRRAPSSSANTSFFYCKAGESATYAGGPCLRTLAKAGWSLTGHIRFVRHARGGDDHNSDARGRNLGKLSVRKFRALSCTAGDDYVLEQLLLLCNRRIELRFDRRNALLRLA